MNKKICPQCGAPIDPSAIECRFCGEKLEISSVITPTNNGTNTSSNTAIIEPIPAVQVNVQQGVSPMYVTGINPNWPLKNKTVAGLLAIFLGGLGIHKFYLGKIMMGIIYLVFCWTYIPSIIAFIEGIIYLVSNDENFQLKHHVRLQ